MNNNEKIKPKEYVSPVAIAPGETLKEIINEIDMSQKELAVRLATCEKHLTQVINGKAEISRDLAYKLEMVLGIESIFWLNLENEYRETLKKITPATILENEQIIARITPYAQLAKEGFVEPTKKILEKVINLRYFFGVSNLNNIPKVNVAYRKANNIKENKYALATWIRIAETQSKNIATDKFNRKKLIDTLPKIRELTTNSSENFFGELANLLASCGIALVIANHLSGTGVHGVTFLNSKRNKLIIQLSVRGKFADKFWFTLFHEISHIVSDETGNFSYIDCDEKTEKDVDKLAKDLLIPEEQYNEFIKNNNVNNYSSIEIFANHIGIHPCIVLGRLKFDGYVPFSSFVSTVPKFKIAKNIRE